MTITIPVSADFDSSKVEAQVKAFQQQLNALGSQIAAANKVQFNPVGRTGVEDMRKMVAQFEALKRVSGDMKKRMNATGQKDAGFFDLDWAKMYPDANSRARQMAKAFQYVTGNGFGPAQVPPGGAPGGRPPYPVPPGAPPRGPGGSAGLIVGGMAQAGLRATGSAGSVAAGALGTGMSAGFGAGLMGLLGGLAALGVGKVVGMATEKIGQAEDNMVAYDKLKRVLGDVNVSFTGLKTVLEGAADGVKVTFDEAARLGTQFAKLGNLTGDQYGSLNGELRTGVGMSRSLGLDPAQGMNFLGTMRGMRQTQDEQGSRRMALLVGETIAKSGAFAKSDEVMEALSGYVTTQTRASLGSNVGGFAGMFSSMVGSGIAGLDPTGAAGLIGRINGNLTAGGAKGEASQFFTAKVGRDMGLDPLQTQLLRESGAFATNDQVFGKGSVYERSMGGTGPSGQGTFYGATMGKLRQQYPGDDQQSRLLRANAAGNHLGISMTQALALDGLGENQMGELEGQLKKAGVKVSDMNFAGLGSLAKVVSGSGADRLGVAGELWSRTGKDKLTNDESTKLDNVMRTGTAQEQKEILAQLIASRDQEMTQGKDIRDTKVGVDNIKTIMAEQLLPVTQAMRDGIMWMAGGKDGKSSRTVREELAKVEIDEKYDDLIKKQGDKIYEARLGELGGSGDPLDSQKRIEESAKLQAEANEEIDRLTKEKARVLEETIKKLREEVEPATTMGPGRSIPGGWRAPGGDSASLGTAPGGTTAASLADISDPTQRANLKSFLEVIGASEGADYDTIVGGSKMGSFDKHPNKVGLVTGDGPSTAAGKYQITNRTWKSLHHGGNAEFTPENQDAAAIELLKRRGAWSDVLAGNWDAAVGKLGNEWQSLPSGTSQNQGKRNWSYFKKQMQAAQERNSQGTAMPSGGAPKGSNSEQKFKFESDPIEIIHKNERGEPMGAPTALATRIRPASPFGADRGNA